MPEITKELAREYADYVTEALRPVLRLHDWRFDWKFSQMDSNGHEVQLGEAHVDYTRGRTTIFIDVTRHEDDLESLIETLMHEVMHTTHHMWSRAVQMVDPIIPAEVDKVAHIHWSDAAEEHVTWVSHVISRFGFSAKDLIEGFEAKNSPGFDLEGLQSESA